MWEKCNREYIIKICLWYSCHVSFCTYHLQKGYIRKSIKIEVLWHSIMSTNLHPVSAHQQKMQYMIRISQRTWRSDYHVSTYRLDVMIMLLREIGYIKHQHLTPFFYFYLIKILTYFKYMKHYRNVIIFLVLLLWKKVVQHTC